MASWKEGALGRGWGEDGGDGDGGVERGEGDAGAGSVVAALVRKERWNMGVEMRWLGS